MKLLSLALQLNTLNMITLKLALVQMVMFVWVKMKIVPHHKDSHLMTF
jgi:hypothetical protein